MKKLYSLIALSSIGLGFSQTILNQSEVASRTVQDPQAVILLPGFQASYTVANPFVAKIGASADTPNNPTDSNAGSGNYSGTVGANKFHDTQGNIEVNGGGQLQYTLPIALPPGVKSVAPQINLVYTSGSGNGIAGYGWNISGITSISRMGKTIEKDGEIKGVQLDYSDYYSFNGQRLVLKSGTYGKDGATYSTEKYSNVVIKSVGAIAGQAWQGPEYWEVTFEDGSQAWYGAAASGTSLARTPIEYNIVKWKDAQGNYITYHYTQSNNVAVIASIQWGGNETLGKSHFNEINFSYNGTISRQLKEVAYVNGLAFIQDRLLNQIQVKSNGSQFKKYLINYTENAANYQIVQNILEYNANGEPSNPVSFSYDSSNNSLWNRSSFTDNDSTRLVGDFDGDGKIDFIKYFDSFSECTQYETQTMYDESEQPYYQDFCVKEEPRPAGLYLFRGLFEEVKKERLYIGTSDFSKSDFEYGTTAISIKGADNTVKPSQGFVLYKKIPNEAGRNDLELNVYSFNDQNQLVKEYSKTVPNEAYDWTDEYYDDGNRYSTYTSIGKLMEMDLDGDGISELLLPIEHLSHHVYLSQDPFPEYKEYSFYNYRYLVINMDNNVPVDKSFSTLTFAPSYQKNSLESYKTGDFDGDGKIDFIRFDSSKRPLLVTFKKDPVTLLFSSSETPFYQGNASVGGSADRALVGDFNGDGKMDLLVPEAIDSFNWNIYLSTGKNFVSQPANISSLFKPDHTDYSESGRYYYYGRHYLVQDLNHDGRSDFIEIGTHARRNRYASNNFSSFIVNVFENKGVLGTNSNIAFQKNNIDGHSESVAYYPFSTSQYNSYPFSYITDKKFYTSTPGSNGTISTPNDLSPISPLVGSFNINNTSNQILLILKGAMLRFSSYDIAPYVRINKISQGGINTEISYGTLDTETTPNLYAPLKKEIFPYVELNKVSQSYAVSQLRQIIPVNGEEKIRKQDFRYRGMIAHLQGKGMVGFRQTARSSWYTDALVNTKIWSGAEIDPLNEGLPIKEWSIKTNDESQIFPADLSLNNTSLLSFKSTQYQIDNLAGGIKAITPTQTTSKDFKKNIKVVSNVIYGDYYLPVQTVSNTNDGFAKITTTLKYIHNPSGIGKDYYIGRPESKTDLVEAYKDSKVEKEEYHYNDKNLLDSVKTNNRGSGWIKQSYTYDGFGNITKKEITNSIDGNKKTEEAAYEEQGRFVVSKKDNLGLVTTIVYNDWGQIKSQTDPLGNILTNTYDYWGKLLTSKHNLTGTTAYTYEKTSSGDAVVSQYDPDGGVKISFTNKLGQNYRAKTKAFASGSYVSKDVEYDALGRKIRESEPYLDGAAPKWNTIEYDDYSRPIKATAFTGKIVESTYNDANRSVTTTETNANNRFKTQVADALGNIASSTDLGGTIVYTYNAAGENTEADYEGNVVKTSYDAWGNKVRFEDPSNGVYTYEYKGYFGALSKSVSPKGEKKYFYNAKGQLESQTETSKDGTATTDKAMSFTYNDKGLLTHKVGTSKGKSFSSYVNYDSYGRVLSSGESSNGKHYMQKGITYDDKGRITSYEKSLYSSGVQTKVVIENGYSNWSGALYQVKDKAQGKVLWELQSANAGGQVLKSILGGTTIENTYDTNNFLANTFHRGNSAGNTVLSVTYTFDAIKNELKSRTTGGDLSISENFAYDANNRLVNWSNPVTGSFANGETKNGYDNKGRITYNNQVGTIHFNNSKKLYQATGATLNAEGSQNYNNDLIQSIAYNENNDPVYIDGVRGDVRFEYGLTAMRQMATYGGNSTLPLGEGWGGAFTKYYSEDGSYEVIRNNQTGQEKYLLYIGGDPYSSNIVYISPFGGQEAGYKFLHKDYLGSILAITDEAGNKLEQRHFDAWGNLTHLKIGANTTMTDKEQIRSYLSNGNLIIDRGYTSHEHFAEVGIIHMNGRLYDPLLRRFLNADENIQDPYNTQNYNKYGYVLNNPLLYSDPSGEIFFFAALVPIFGEVLAGVVAGAIGGAIIGSALYLGQAAITGNWSWGGFAKSFFMGAVTGAVSGALGQVFSTSGFWAAVGNGSLAGAGSGGVTSIISGQNFFEGVLKGAVIGGAIGAVSYAINFYSKGGGKEAGARFWSGKAKLDLSKGYGAHGVDTEVLNSEIDATYVGEYRGVKVYESSVGFGKGAKSGGLTLPPNKMVVGKGAYALRDIFGDSGTYDLFTHEFGHILQTKKVGEAAFYDIIAPSSFYSATVNTYRGHNQFWTETWANQLSYDYFTNRNLPFNLLENIAKPLSQKYIDIFTKYLSIRGFNIPTSWNKIP